MGFQSAINTTIGAAAIGAELKANKEKKETAEYEGALKDVANYSDELNKDQKKIDKGQLNVDALDKQLANYSTDEAGNIYTKSGRKASKASANKYSKLMTDREAASISLANLKEKQSAILELRRRAQFTITTYRGKRGIK